MTVTELLPCGRQGPYEMKTQTRRTTSVHPVTCNRPQHHEGNCAWSSETHPRLYEWTSQGEKVRPR